MPVGIKANLGAHSAYCVLESGKIREIIQVHKKNDFLTTWCNL
jgi:hypothetical protein